MLITMLCAGFRLAVSFLVFCCIFTAFCILVCFSLCLHFGRWETHFIFVYCVYEWLTIKKLEQLKKTQHALMSSPLCKLQVQLRLTLCSQHSQFEKYQIWKLGIHKVVFRHGFASDSDPVDTRLKDSETFWRKHSHIPIHGSSTLMIAFPVFTVLKMCCSLAEHKQSSCIGGTVCAKTWQFLVPVFWAYSASSGIYQP